MYYCYYPGILHVEGEELARVLVGGGVEHEPAVLVEGAEPDGEVEALQVPPGQLRVLNAAVVAGTYVTCVAV